VILVAHGSPLPPGFAQLGTKLEVILGNDGQLRTLSLDVLGKN
jgi:hypothetical protein